MFANISEEQQLEEFLDAYAEATGESLEVVGHRDRPDFWCRRKNGSLIGVEVTIITRHPDAAFFDDAINAVRFMDAWDASAHFYARLERKEALRRSPTWHLPDHCILVLSLPDCPLSELGKRLCKEDFQENGFEEIWIADHSEMEEYGAVELFGLKPSAYWGHHSRNRGKPFG
jgi:hypothetical protein